MTPLLQRIEAILRPQHIQRGLLVLHEAGEDTSCRDITLRKRGPAVVLKPDQRPPGVCDRTGCTFTFSANDRLFPLFRLDVAGLTTVCDYIVFCQEEAKEDARLFVLLCELKSNNSKGARRQVENGRLLADYVLQMAAHHGKLRSPSRIEYHGLIFTPVIPPYKGSLKRSRCTYEQHTDGMADMPFAYYRCGAEYPLSHFCT